MSKEWAIYHIRAYRWFDVLYPWSIKMTETKIREELEEITKELVRLQNQKYRSDIVEKNKEYKEICYKMWFLEERKKNLLNLIKKLHG